MLRLAKLLPGLLVATAFYVTPAHAQATRTWVSGVGDDVNPCSRTAPCKTFAGAISKTAAGGEINCLDPAGFGAVTINKSLVIDCHYTEGGALAGGNGIVVNAGAGDVVVIRGLDIFGVNPPTNGVRFIAGGALHIEDTVIRRFNAAGSFGVSFQPAGSSLLFITNTTITQNGSATGGGILIQPTGAAGTARVMMNNVRVDDNANNDLQVNTTGNTTATGINIVIRDSTFTGSGTGINVVTPNGTQTAIVHLDNVTVANNSSTGILANGPTGTVRVNNSTITGNAMGVNPLGGSQIGTFGNNRLVGNPTVGAPNNGAFNGTPFTPS